MSQFHNPATATLEEARHVVELIRKSLRYASGEDAADLSYELADWERVVRERSVAPVRLLAEDACVACFHDAHHEVGPCFGMDPGPDGEVPCGCRAYVMEDMRGRIKVVIPDPMQPLYDEQDAAAIEEDRRFEQYRDDEIAARHTGAD